MTVWKFNKGEWTEAYVFLRLLGEGRIYGASSELTKDEQTFIDILNIIKDEPDCYLKFERFFEGEIAKVRAMDEEDVPFIIITAPELNEKATYLYHEIMSSPSGERSIEVPSMRNYFERLKITTLKANLSNRAKERYGAKADIIITSKNSIDNSRTTEGFSIKSRLGSNPTLFNCSQTSGFSYQIHGCDIYGMHHLNALNSFKAIISAIRENYSLQFVSCRNSVFEQNICIVDSRMDEILHHALLLFYGYYGKTISSDMHSVCKALAELNPIKCKNPSVFYEAKIKDLLFASFAGLTASTPWSGRKRISGGYIDVSQTGELLYYRAISDDIFTNFLFHNTKFEVPDRGIYKQLALSRALVYLNEHRNMTQKEENAIIYVNGINGKKRDKKGNFGYVYQNGNNFFIDLNFQIRFR